MSAILTQLMKMLDSTVHPDIKKRGGMPLLRGRMLSLNCIMGIMASFSFIAIIFLSHKTSLRTYFIFLIMGQWVLFLILNRWIRYNTVLSSISLISTSVLIAVGIFYQAKSIFASGFLWFPVLIMPAFLLCGRRLGLMVSGVIILVAMVTIALCFQFGNALPFEGDRIVSMRSMLMSLVISNALILGMVAIYFHLLQVSEKNSLEQRTWVQRAARMQELLQMSGHFALQTNGPLDVLGTALHNLEEPLKNIMQPRTLLPLLEPVESGIQELAAVSKSFSLFSRRYLEEGLEQTSVNAVLQHVDTIYNVGAVMRRARLHWEKLTPDILIYTQTAKLVMLLISLLRSIAAEDGTQLTAMTFLEADGLEILLRYNTTTEASRISVHSNADAVFDPELTEDLIQELCSELGIQRHRQREGNQQIYRLKLLQTRCQARLA